MRELRALGLTDDGKSLVLVDLSRGAEGERFRVAADERLRAALRSGAPRAAVAAQTETRVESALSPREIQSRLRAGATADEVAKAAGIPVGRVQRYEGPILAERARVVSEARNASAPGPHRNAPGRPLGGLVDDRLEQESLDPEAVEWEAKRRPDGTWLVTLAMEPRGIARATWSWDPQARRVRAADAGATAILAPMPAPSTGPDSLTAVAEATGVATAEAPQEKREALAVGDDGRRRAAAPSRAASGRPSGLVVLAGRSTDDADSAARTAELADSASLEADVPGGSPATPPAPRAERSRTRSETADVLLPGTEPASSLGTTPDRSQAEAVRASRQERFPHESASAAPGPLEDAPRPQATAGSATVGVADVPVPAVAEEEGPDSGAPSAPKPPVRAGSGRRRSAVPAWDDIMFGARRG